MARSAVAQDYNPYVSVEAPGAPPDDYEHIQTSPGQFGAQVGQGLEALGQGATKAAEVYSQIAADQAANNYESESTKLLFGDPDKPGDVGFYGLRGEDAMKAMPTVRQRLLDLRQQAGESLFNPLSRERFDAATRTQHFRLLSEVGRHYDQAAQNWGTKVNSDTIDNAAQNVLSRPDDDTNFAAQAARAMDAAKQGMQLQGALGNEEIFNHTMTEVRRKVDMARIEGWIAQGQYAKAKQYIDANGDTLKGPTLDSLTAKLDSKTRKLNTDSAALEALGLPTVGVGALPNGNPLSVGGAIGNRGVEAIVAPEQYRGVISNAAQTYNVPEELLTRMLHAENGFRAEGTSSAGAQGIAQFIPSTAARYGVNVHDTTSSIQGAAHYLADLHAQRGSWLGALTGYLGGDPRNDPSYTRSGVPQLAVSLDGGSANVPAGRSAAPQGFARAAGDSIAVQQINHGVPGSAADFKTGADMPGTARVGAPPSEVLRRINDEVDADPKAFAGVNFLSTGASNGPSEVALAADQIAAMKKGGATAIVIPGVGPGVPNAAQVNAQLANIAQANGAVFFQPQVKWQADGIHPADANAVRAQGLQALAAAPAGQPGNAPDQLTGQPQPAPIPAAQPNAAATQSRTGLPSLTDAYMNILRNPKIKSDEEVRQAFATATAVHNAMEADAARAERIAAQQQKQLMESRENEIWKDVYSQHPTITAQQIAVDPAFNADPKLRDTMIKMVNDPPGSAVPPAQSYAAALSLLDRIRAPYGDPNKLTDVADVYGAASRGFLNKGDLDFVLKQYNDIRTPGGEALNAAKGDFIKKYAPFINRSNPLLGKADTIGSAREFEYQKFIDQKIDEYRKTNKDPINLFLPTSPDFLGKPEIIQYYQPSMQDSLKGITAFTAGGGVTPLPPLQPFTPGAQSPEQIETQQKKDKAEEKRAPTVLEGPPGSRALPNGGISVPLPPPPAPGALPPRGAGETAEDYLRRIGR